MTDTQWPRYYVFEQPEADGEMIHAGSVHAPDGEMALITARDVFGRRPRRTTMWVVRDRDIFSRTRQQLEKEALETGETPSTTTKHTLYQVFVKRSQKGVCVRVGEVGAPDHETALRLAVEKYRSLKALLWWIIRDEDIRRAGEGEHAALFDSSPGKSFRHENEYPVRTMMMELKKKRKSRKD